MNIIYIFVLPHLIFFFFFELIKFHQYVSLSFSSFALYINMIAVNSES